MIRIKINNRTVEAQPGATVLEAARAAGIAIPSLCWQKGFPPSTSCFVCAVEVEGSSQLLPSCALKAEEGMAVRTDTEAVALARRSAIELLLSDHAGDCEAPCHYACPVALPVPEAIRLVLAGKPEEAAQLLRRADFMADVHERLCPRYCERACRRKQRDDAVNVRGMALALLEKHPPADEGMSPAPSSGKTVAVVGAGPAGMSAAWHLAQRGHGVTLFDANDEPGGLLRYAMPDFRLPGGGLARSVAALVSAGVEFCGLAVLGRDIFLDGLRAESDAVVLALGAAGREGPDMSGAELAQDGYAVLRQLRLGEPAAFGGTPAVVGMDEAAVDLAVALARLGEAAHFVIPAQAARKARMSLDFARKAGVEVVVAEGAVSLEQAKGGFQFTFGGGGGFVATAAIGMGKRTPDEGLLEALGLAGSDCPWVNRETQETSLPGVFAAGEMVGGDDFAVRAAASGALAARSTGRFLRGRPADGRRHRVSVFLTHLGDKERDALFAKGSDASRQREAGNDLLGTRAPLPAQCADAHADGAGLSEEGVRTEAFRCFRCDCAAKDDCRLRELAVAFDAHPRRFRGERRPWERDASHSEIVYESGKCVACQRCVDATAAAGEKYGLTFIARGFHVRTGVPLGRDMREALNKSAAECVAACPTGAIAFRRETGEG